MPSVSDATAGVAGMRAADRITVSDLTMAYGDFVIQRDLNFAVRRGEVFIIM